MLTLLAIWGPGARAYGDDERDERMTKVHVEQGTDHFRAGRYDPSVPAFRQAKEFVNSPALIWNVARAYEELDDFRNAVHYLEELVAEVCAERLGHTELVQCLDMLLGQIAQQECNLVVAWSCGAFSDDCDHAILLISTSLAHTDMAGVRNLEPPPAPPASPASAPSTAPPGASGSKSSEQRLTSPPHTPHPRATISEQIRGSADLPRRQSCQLRFSDALSPRLLAPIFLRATPGPRSPSIPDSS